MPLLNLWKTYDLSLALACITQSTPFFMDFPMPENIYIKFDFSTIGCILVSIICLSQGGVKCVTAYSFVAPEPSCINRVHTSFLVHQIWYSKNVLTLIYFSEC